MAERSEEDGLELGRSARGLALVFFAFFLCFSFVFFFSCFPVFHVVCWFVCSYCIFCPSSGVVVCFVSADLVVFFRHRNGFLVVF